MKFIKSEIEKDLIDAEGTILSLVESVDEDEPLNERLYLKALCNEGRNYIYCKVNHFALKLFFQGRLTLKELFLLRSDESYIIEEMSNDGDDKFQKCFFDEDKQDSYIGKIEVGERIYYSLSPNMRIENPFTDVLRVLENYYINGLVTVPQDWNL